MTLSTFLPEMLLVESQFVLRRTVVSVAQQLRIARFKEAVDDHSARQLLASQGFEAVVIDFASLPAPFELLTQLREGRFASEADIAIVVVTSGSPDIDIDLDERLHRFGSLSVMKKPFKIADLLQTVLRATAQRQRAAETQA